MPQVSILIPCHNNSTWVGRAIESALVQTCDDTEIIVLDDGSTDDSLEVINSFGDRIRIEASSNRGGNAARNKLASMASGEWLQFLDADDCLLPDKVESQLAMASDDTDAVYGSVTIEWWGDEKVQHTEVSAPDQRHDIYMHWLNWQLAQTGAVLWRAGSLRAIGGWNEKFPCCQDNEICLRALQQGLVFKQSSDAGAIYRIWSSGTVSRKDPTMLFKTKTHLMDQMISWLKANGKLTRNHVDVASEVFFGMARGLAAHNLNQAEDFADDRKEKGLFKCSPGAAPFIYRILYKVFGFSTAEKIASYRRRS